MSLARVAKALGGEIPVPTLRWLVKGGDPGPGTGRSLFMSPSQVRAALVLRGLKGLSWSGAPSVHDWFKQLSCVPVSWWVDRKRSLWWSVDSDWDIGERCPVVHSPILGVKLFTSISTEIRLQTLFGDAAAPGWDFISAQINPWDDQPDHPAHTYWNDLPQLFWTRPEQSWRLQPLSATPPALSLGGETRTIGPWIWQWNPLAGTVQGPWHTHHPLPHWVTHYPRPHTTTKPWPPKRPKP